MKLFNKKKKTIFEGDVKRCEKFLGTSERLKVESKKNSRNMF